MNFRNPYWTMQTKIELLQRWVLVHSYIYYELGKNIVSDKMFDDNARQLVAMQKEDRKAHRRSYYHYAFHDFDGSTGFDLFTRLTKSDRIRIEQVANNALRVCSSK